MSAVPATTAKALYTKEKKRKKNDKMSIVRSLKRGGGEGRACNEGGVWKTNVLAREARDRSRTEAALKETIFTAASVGSKFGFGGLVISFLLRWAGMKWGCQVM